MYKATLKSKERGVDGIVTVIVEYSNGIDTVTDTFKPQDKQGYLHRVQSILTSLNTTEEFMSEDNVNKEVVFEKSVISQEDQDKMTWFRDFGRLERVQRLIDLQVLTGTENQIVNLRNKVKANFKATYVADM